MLKELAHTLIETGYATSADIEEALQRQVLHGGSLGTNLLEAGVLDEEALIGCLGQATGLPVAGRDAIGEIDPQLTRLFPLLFAETYHLVPLRVEGAMLRVLVSEVPDALILNRIRDRLGLSLIPVITSEIRLHGAMSQLYGTELLPRFSALLAHIDGNTVSRDPAKGTYRGSVLSWGISSTPISAHAAKDATGRKLDLRRLLSEIEATSERDPAVNILLGAGAAMFDFSALFLVQEKSFNGWRGTDSVATQRITRVSLPLSTPSVLQTVYVTGGHYLGPVPQSRPNQKLLADLGRPAPRAALMAPIKVSGKMTAIFYADNGDRGISQRRVAAVLLLTQRLGIALERAIRKRKSSVERVLSSQSRAPGSTDSTRLSESKFESLTHEVAPSLSPPLPGIDARLSKVLGDSLEVELVDSESDDSAIEVTIEQDVVAIEEDEADQAWESVSFEGIDSSPDATVRAFRQGLNRHSSLSEANKDDSYVAFKDVNEGPEQSLDEWQDVLVDTTQAAEKKVAGGARSTPSHRTSATWEQVIERAKGASQWTRAASSKSTPTPEAAQAGDDINETELLLDSLEVTASQQRRDAIEKLLALGDKVNDALRMRFPGNLLFDPLETKEKIPPFSECSGLTELLFARGTDVASLVVPFLDDPDPIRRFFAIYYLMAVPYPPALDALARRLYDRESRNRHLAADALRSYGREANYQRIVEGIRGQLSVPVLEAQVSAVQLLGQLRDPAAVPALIPLLVSPTQELSRAAASSLAVICAQEFGYDASKWSLWWRNNYNRPRPLWLMQGLRADSVSIRRIADHELRILTGRRSEFDANAAIELRQKAIAAWESWWGQVSGEIHPQAGG
ncbi:MAG: hypothetical protein R3C68_07660 [Myxococcota bacterium]